MIWKLRRITRFLRKVLEGIQAAIVQIPGVQNGFIERRR
jgi:hypothetical protein